MVDIIPGLWNSEQRQDRLSLIAKRFEIVLFLKLTNTSKPCIRPQVIIKAFFIIAPVNSYEDDNDVFLYNYLNDAAST